MANRHIRLFRRSVEVQTLYRELMGSCQRCWLDITKRCSCWCFFYSHLLLFLQLQLARISWSNIDWTLFYLEKWSHHNAFSSFSWSMLMLMLEERKDIQTRLWRVRNNIHTYFLKNFSYCGYIVDIYVLYNSSPNSFLSWVNSSDSSVTLAIN